MHEKSYLYLSGGIFGIVAIAHLVRVVYQLPVQVGGSEFPVWLSWAGLAIAGILSGWAFRLARPQRAPVP
jgi:hypothetical protein